MDAGRENDPHAKSLYDFAKQALMRLAEVKEQQRAGGCDSGAVKSGFWLLALISRYSADMVAYHHNFLVGVFQCQPGLLVLTMYA